MKDAAGAEERPADGALAPGERLGKYEIIRRIAVGGMGDIYVARASGGPIGFEKIVVIKRVLPHLAVDTTFLAMFLDEARLAATLQHGNLAQVYDAGVDGKNHYMVMEYLHGEDVRSILKQLAKLKRRLP